VLKRDKLYEMLQNKFVAFKTSHKNSNPFLMRRKIGMMSHYISK